MALFKAGYSKRRLAGKTFEVFWSVAKDDRLAGTFAATVIVDHTSGSFLAKGAAACLFPFGRVRRTLKVKGCIWTDHD